MKEYNSKIHREHPSTQTIYTSGSQTQVIDVPGAFTSITKRGQSDPNRAFHQMMGMISPSQPLFFELVENRLWAGSLQFINRYKQWYPPYGWEIEYDMSTVGCLDGFIYDPYTGIPQFDAFDRSQVLASATQKCLAKTKDQKVNMGQVLAEAGQTASLIQQTAFRLADFIALLRQKKLRTACRVIGLSPSRGLRKRFGRAWEDSPSHAVGNAFIELHFGWKPLVSDVVGYAETLAQLTQTIRSEYTRKQARSSRSSTIRKSMDTGRGVVSVTNVTNIEVSVGCTFQLTDGITDHLTASLGLQNPLALLEELTPFSFVLDWFVDIGGVLSNLDATFGLTFIDGWVKTVETVNQSAVFLAHNENGNENRLRTGAAERTYKSVRVTREPLLGFPSSFVPVVSNPFSLKHIGLSLALIRQRI